MTIYGEWTIKKRNIACFEARFQFHTFRIHRIQFISTLWDSIYNLDSFMNGEAGYLWSIATNVYMQFALKAFYLTYLNWPQYSKCYVTNNNFSVSPCVHFRQDFLLFLFVLHWRVVFLQVVLISFFFNHYST